MALKKCINCGKKIKEDVKECPFCKQDYKELDFNNLAKIWLWMSVILNLAGSIGSLTHLNFLNGSLSLLLCVSNLLLLINKEFIYFLTVLIAVTITFIANVIVGEPIVTSLLGYFNPFITYLLTMMYWDKLKGEKNGTN